VYKRQNAAHTTKPPNPNTKINMARLNDRAQSSSFMMEGIEVCDILNSTYLD
jgi:hypothetical protein